MYGLELSDNQNLQKKKKVFYKAVENHKCYFHTIILKSFELPFKVSFIKSIELIPKDQI